MALDNGKYHDRAGKERRRKHYMIPGFYSVINGPYRVSSPKKKDKVNGSLLPQ